MNPFKGLCMAFFIFVFRRFCNKKRNFEPEINGHEVSAKAVQFSLTIMIDEGKVLRSYQELDHSSSTKKYQMPDLQ